MASLPFPILDTCRPWAPAPRTEVKSRGLKTVKETQGAAKVLCHRGWDTDRHIWGTQPSVKPLRAHVIPVRGKGWEITQKTHIAISTQMPLSWV